jgi:hypothetical protein
MTDKIDKGYTKKRYRRKIPKVGRSYERHMYEDKTFDKSDIEDNNMSIENEIEKMAELIEKGGPGSGKRGVGFRSAEQRKRQQDKNKKQLEESKAARSIIAKYNLTKEELSELRDLAAAEGVKPSTFIANNEQHIVNNFRKSQENNMSIENEIEKMAEQMEKSTVDPKAELIETIKAMGPEGLKKSLGDLNDEQAELLKEVLEEMNKSEMSFDQVSPEKKMTRIDRSGHELEDGSDDEDEKVMQAAMADAKINHQGDISPEGREGQIVKAKDMEDKKEDKKIAEKEAKEEVKDHEDKMHKMCKSQETNVTKEELVALKNEIIKSYEDAGLAYNEELIKSEMKKKMLKEEDQVEMGGQDKGGKKDRADKESCPEIEVGKDADETADEAVAKISKMKKSIVWGDPQANLRALSGGRNHHFSVNGYYDEAIRKSNEEASEETLEKSETENESLDINDVIEKGLDKAKFDVASEEIFKSQNRGDFTNNSFSDADLAGAMNVSEEELKEILGETEGK